MKKADTELSDANIKKLEQDIEPHKTNVDKADPPKDKQVADGEKPPKSEILEDDPNLKDRELDDLKKYEDDVDSSTKKKMEEKADGDIEKGKNHKSKMKALVMARIITETNDKLDTPVPALLAELSPLRAMKGVEKFAAEGGQNGKFHIFMFGCKNELNKPSGYDIDPEKGDKDKIEPNFTLTDYNSFEGANSSDVAAWLEANGWSGINTNPNRVYTDGMRYTNGIKGEQIRIMSGGPTRSIPKKTGPYMEISIRGVKTVVALFGNPTL